MHRCNALLILDAKGFSPGNKAANPVLLRCDVWSGWKRTNARRSVPHNILLPSFERVWPQCLTSLWILVEARAEKLRAQMFQHNFFCPSPRQTSCSRPEASMPESLRHEVDLQVVDFLTHDFAKKVRVWVLVRVWELLAKKKKVRVRVETKLGALRNKNNVKNNVSKMSSVTLLYCQK